MGNVSWYRYFLEAVEEKNGQFQVKCFFVLEHKWFFVKFSFSVIDYNVHSILA